MKKILICLSLAVLCLNTFADRIYAEEYELGGSDGYSVVLDENLQFNTDAYKEDIGEVLGGMQPGDSATIKYSLQNHYKDPLEWYMSNEAYQPFEDDARSSVAGGGYSYSLVYTDEFGEEKVLYDSSSVGGEGLAEGQEGLEGATNALKEKEAKEESLDGMFMLDTLNPGKTSYLTMKFALDGESQPNAYQEVVGEIKVNFGVEVTETPKEEPKPKEETVIKEEKTTVKKRRVVYMPYTGDESNLPYFVLAELILLNGLLITIFAYVAYKKKQEAR